MAEKRTKTMELRAIRDQMKESPPPPPAGTTVREWLAGLALMNPELMRDVPAGERAREAVRLADELVGALSAPRAPTQESMQAPSEEEMAAWEADVAQARETKERQTRATVPGMKRKATLVGMPNISLLPPPPAPPQNRPKDPAVGRYSYSLREPYDCDNE